VEFQIVVDIVFEINICSSFARPNDCEIKENKVQKKSNRRRFNCV